MAYALGAFLLWGLFPLYFRQLASLPPEETLLARLFWTFVFLMVVLAVRRQWQWFGKAIRNRRLMLGFIASALLIAANWGVFLFAVSAGHVIEISFGNFISPLLTVLFGWLMLKETLRPLQKLAVLIAGIGVIWLAVMAGTIPWLGLITGITFAAYSVLRKLAPLDSLEGLALELIIVMPLVLLASLWMTQATDLVMLSLSWEQQVLLVLCGPVTAIPMLLYTKGARAIPLSVLGVLQYIAPTCQLLSGVWLFGEPFDQPRLIGFGIIWLGLAVFSGEGLLRRWQR